MGIVVVAKRSVKPEIYREQIFGFTNTLMGLIAKCRVWMPRIENDEVCVGTMADVKRFVSNELATRLADGAQWFGAFKRVADDTLNQYSINAIEIVNEDGEGVVHYADWP